MGYKIADRFIEKISVPVVCRIADQKFEFENGAECAKAEFENEAKKRGYYKWQNSKTDALHPTAPDVHMRTAVPVSPLTLKSRPTLIPGSGK